ncbi:hypothetical protein F5Y16DRAFT_396348 [Xylariaceae sp. FL0255]|nr:hypothetical protein F5Y16DRAFT_396348 [Xylariaceae sp. FL0255]
MSVDKRHTLFLDDALSGDETSSVNDVQPVPHPGTYRTLQQRRLIGQAANRGVKSTVPTSTHTRFPVKTTNDDDEVSLTPVLTGSPWSHYEKKYRVKYGFSFGIIISRSTSRQPFMIRTITGRNAEAHIQDIRQLSHANLAKSVEIYTESDQSYFLISEFLPTSLLHLCRAPIYPTEPQLGSILH